MEGEADQWDTDRLGEDDWGGVDVDPEIDVLDAETLADEDSSSPVVQRRICVIIPAYNEAPAIGQVVRNVRAAMPTAHVLVVDDGSRDTTAHEAALNGATVMQLPLNLGIGGAVQAGYRYAQRYDFDIAIQVDGDGQHDPREARRILEPIERGEADLVVGSRWLGRGAYVAPKGRRIGMRILAAMVTRGTGGTITDSTSGFRAVGRRGIGLFAEKYPTDFPEVETLVLAARQGLRLQEVGVRMDQRVAGESSLAGVKSAYYMLRVCMMLLVDGLRRRGRG